MRQGNPEIGFARSPDEQAAVAKYSIDLSEVRIGNWIRTDDFSYVHINAITEICLEYQGPETKQDQTDDYEVTVLTEMTDLWLPNKQDREIARKHNNFFNQMSEQQRRDIFRGTKADCEQVIRIIMMPEV